MVGTPLQLLFRPFPLAGGRAGGGTTALHGSKARHALRLEELHRVGFELVIARKAFVQAHHALGLALRHRTDELERQLSLQTDEARAARHAVGRLARQGQCFDW